MLASYIITCTSCTDALAIAFHILSGVDCDDESGKNVRHRIYDAAIYRAEYLTFFYRKIHDTPHAIAEGPRGFAHRDERCAAVITDLYISATLPGAQWRPTLLCLWNAVVETVVHFIKNVATVLGGLDEFPRTLTAVLNTASLWKLKRTLILSKFVDDVMSLLTHCEYVQLNSERRGNGGGRRVTSWEQLDVLCARHDALKMSEHLIPVADLCLAIRRRIMDILVTIRFNGLMMCCNTGGGAGRDPMTRPSVRVFLRCTTLLKIDGFSSHDLETEVRERMLSVSDDAHRRWNDEYEDMEARLQSRLIQLESEPSDTQYPRGRDDDGGADEGKGVDDLLIYRPHPLDDHDDWNQQDQDNTTSRSQYDDAMKDVLPLTEDVVEQNDDHASDSDMDHILFLASLV